eukprot:scaffold184951_cov21-Tisochrysis_lutea.AAC.1
MGDRLPRAVGHHGGEGRTHRAFVKSSTQQPMNPLNKITQKPSVQRVTTYPELSGIVEEKGTRMGPSARTLPWSPIALVEAVWKSSNADSRSMKRSGRQKQVAQGM